MRINEKKLLSYVTTYVTAASFIFFITALLGIYLVQTYNWLSLTLNQLREWVLNPIIYYKPVEVYNPLLGGISFFLIILVGVFLTFLVLPKESHNDKLLFIIISIAMGLGSAGIIAILLIVSNVLNRGLLIFALLSLILILGALAYLNGFRIRKSFMQWNFDWNIIKNIKQHTTEFTIILILSIFVFFSYYHALMYPVLEWDALIYHAEVARLIYEHKGMPLIAGPSISLEISSNYPPLFPAIGAFFYIIIDNFDDFYLRLISPIAGLLTILTTYKLGSLIANKRYGLFSSLVLVMFPLFVGYSVYPTYYSLLTLFITLSLLFIIQMLFTGNKQYLILSSIFVGFSLSSSYLALYYLTFFILCIACIVYIKRLSLRYVLYILTIILLIGSIWYIRNLSLLGDPVYPFGYNIFKGKNIDPELLYYTVIHLKRDSGFLNCYDYFCRLIYYLAYVISDWQIYPPLLPLFLLGSFLLIVQKKYYNLIVALWPLFFIIILPIRDWFWTRYIILILPSVSVIVPKALLHLVNILTLIRVNPSVKIFVLISILLFPSIIFSIVGSNQFYCSQDKDSCIYNLIHPGFKDDVLKKTYKDYDCWAWINEHLHKDEMVAAFDPRTYYLKYDRNVFFLDGWDARELYKINDPEDILEYLNQKNVRYIMIINWIEENENGSDPGYFILPLTRYLNSTFFPVIFHNPDPDGQCTIYEVDEIGLEE